MELNKPTRTDDSYKKVTADEALAFVDGKVQRTSIKPVTANTGSSSLVRFLTFVSTNLDLLSLFFLLICVFSLGYLVRCLQTNLSADQIRLGIEAFVEILVVVFASTAALFFKLAAGQGAVSHSLTRKFQGLFVHLKTRKEKVSKGEISPFGRSIESK